MKFLIPVIAFSGFLIGLLLRKLIKEEIKPGKKYFLIIEKAVLLAIIIILLSLTKDYFHLFIGVITGFILAFILTRYLFLGLSTTISLFLNNITLLITSLIFIYGIPYTALKSRKILINLIFFLPLLILLIPNHFIFTDYLIGISSGALFNYLIRK